MKPIYCAASCQPVAQEEMEMSETVADTLVGTLQQIGVKQIFALIGDR